nr:MAG TPA: Neck appendage protein [Caudoviricetes sp.]
MIYLTEGNIPLNAAYDDNITQEANSTYQLIFRFPTNNVLWQRLREETFLTADDLHGEQDFVIFEVEKKHGYIQVYANQVFTLLNNYVVNPISLDRQTGSTALSQFAGSITRDNPFSFFSNIEDRHTFNIGSKNAMEAFAKDKHSIIGQWGGDLVRHGYQVRLLKNGGSENESLFMYKKNLSSYQHKTSTKSLKTRITFIATVKGEGEKAVDKHYKVVVDSPLINKYSQIYEDVVEVNDQDVKDEASLREYGKQYFRTSLCDLMEDSLEIDVVGQSDVPVQMFDVAGIYHGTFDLDVRKKITKYTYSPMAKKLKSIGFGEFKSGLANAIGNIVSDAVKGETQQLQGNFERQLLRELKNADLAFERKKEELTNQFTDEVNAINAKAEENKQKLSDEINRRLQEFNPSGFEEVKAKSEEALKQAGAAASLAAEARNNALDNIRDLNAFKTSAQKEREKLSDELKRYSREETTNQIIAIRERISSDYVAKSTFTENVEGTRQRFEALTRDNEARFAEYKQGIDGRIADITSQVSGKVNEVDFQRVRETSQLYERVLGNTEQGLPDKISRLVMSNEIFQTEVGKYSTQGGPNMLRNSRADDGLKYWTEANGRLGFTSHGFYFNGQKRMFELRPGAIVKSPRFIVKRSADYTLNILGFDNNSKYLKIYFCKRKKGSTADFEEKQLIYDGKPKWTNGPVFDNEKTIKKSFQFNIGNFDDGYLQFEYDRNNPNKWGGLFMTELDFYEGTNDRKWQPAPEDSAEPIEAVRTKVTQLAGSYAIQNLNSAGDLINGINIGANGHNRFVGKLTHITGETLIDNAVIKSAMIDKLKTANFEAGSVTTTILDAEAVTAEKVKFDTAFIQRLVSQQAFIDELFAKQATITRIQSIDFTANHIKGGVLSGLNGNATFDLNNGQIRMQSSPTSWKTTWDPNGIAFRGSNNDVWGAMGGDSGGGVGIYMRGSHAFNLVVNHSDSGRYNGYTPLRVKYGDGTYLQFSPGGPSYNLLILFKTIFDNFKYNDAKYFDMR